MVILVHYYRAVNSIILFEFSRYRFVYGRTDKRLVLGRLGIVEPNKVTINQRSRAFADPFQVIAVRPIFRLFDQSGDDWVQMDVTAEIDRILVFGYLNAFDAAFKQGPAAALLPIEGLGVTVEQPLDEAPDSAV